MIQSLTLYGRCFYKAAADTVNHDGIELAGYLAFLSLLSLFPFLVLLVALGGVLGEHQIGQEFVTVLFSYVPSHVSAALNPRVTEIVSGPPQSVLTVAILGAIWTASSAVEGLRTALNRAYRVSTPPAYPLRRLLSIAQLLLLTAVVIIVMIGLIFVPILYDYLSYHMNFAFGSAVAWVSIGLTFVVLFFVVASIYYVLPNIRQSFITTFPGTATVVLMWILMARLFSLYLSQFNQVNLIYGSLGGIIAALLFFYLISLIMIFGAELNYRLEKALGHTIEEKESA